MVSPQAYKKLLAYLQTAKNQNASDIHFVANSRTKLRIKDSLRDVGEPLTGDELKEILFASMSEEQAAFLEAQKEIDFGLRVPSIGRFRANIFMAQGNYEAVLRVIKENASRADELGLPEVINKLASLHDGLILVSGATGSGKSTTLAAMIDYVNTNYAKRIITVEDPVELLHHNKKSVISQREVGEDTVSYTKALKSLMRQNPDVILIGEIRDKETADSALQAAQTGHLVLSTVHASSAEETVNRFAGIYPAEERANIKKTLSYTLKGVIAQRLTTDVNNNKIPILEIMTSTKRVRDSIWGDANDDPSRESLHTIIEESYMDDMVTLDLFLIDLLTKGQITRERALQEATNSLWMRQALQQRSL